MAIDIYDKAKLIKRENFYYYFLKNGSKNCFTCPFQSIVDNNFENKFILRQSRESNWHLIAIGNEQAVKDDKIADTYWNCPTSSLYGVVRFGNKKNVALFFAKQKNRVIDYSLLSDVQKENIDKEITHFVGEAKMEYTINLSNIPENKKVGQEIEYCNNHFKLDDNCLEYNGKRYWNLDNL